jgi:hypothetical protein
MLEWEGEKKAGEGRELGYVLAVGSIHTIIPTGEGILNIRHIARYAPPSQ